MQTGAADVMGEIDEEVLGRGSKKAVGTRLRYGSWRSTNVRTHKTATASRTTGARSTLTQRMVQRTIQHYI